MASGRLGRQTPTTPTPAVQKPVVPTNSGTTGGGRLGRLSETQAATPPSKSFFGPSQVRLPAPLPSEDKPTGGAKNFLFNLPNTVLRGAVGQPVEFLQKLGATIGDLGAKALPLNKVIKLSPETKAKLAPAVQGFKQGFQSDLTLPFSTGDKPDAFIKASTPFASPKEAAGSALEAAINVGTTIITGGAGSVAKSVGKEVLKETVEAGAKKGATALLKKVATKQFAKEVLKDFGIGSAYGVATELQDKDPNRTLADRATNVAVSGAAGVALPRVIGAVAKGGFAAIGRLSRGVAGLVDSAASKLENFAGKETVARGERYYKQTQTPITSKAQSIAGRVSGGLRALQTVPERLKTAVLDRYAPVTAFQKRAEAAGIKTGDLHDNVHAAGYRAGGQAEARLDDYINMKDSYGGDWQNVKELSHYLDDIDRLARGQKVAGDRTGEDVAASIVKLQREIGSEAFNRAKQGQEDLQVFLTEELQKSLDAGLISEKQFKDIKAAHPNYIPHNVLDFQDAPKVGVGASMNVSKNGIQKAKGSVRDIDDIDSSIVDRIFQNHSIIEKNKAIKSLVDVGKQMDEFTPLRTAENVKARQEHFAKLKELREQLDGFKEAIRDGRVTSKEQIKRINSLSEKLKGEEDTFLSQIGALHGENDQELKLYQEALKTKAAREAVANSVFPESEVEAGYQRFKRDAARQKALLDEAVDDAKLKTLRPKENLDQKYFDGGAVSGQTNDEMLQAFRARAIKERDTPTPPTAFMRSFESRQKAADEQLGKIQGVEDKLDVEKGVKGDVDTFINHLESGTKDLNEARSTLFADLANLQDSKIKAVDYEKQGLGKISYFKDGIKEEYLAPKDLVDSLKGLDETESGAIGKFLSNSVLGKVITAPARLVRALATTFNPVFTVFRNPARDIQTVMVTAKASAADYAYGMAKAIAGDSSDDFYRSAMKSGALQGGIYREGLKPSEILSKKLTKDSVFTKLTSPLKAIESVGNVMEEMTRLAVFRRSLAEGATPQEAAKIARNATVDFGKAGNATRVLNKVIPFLNARVQGTVNLAKAIKEDPTRAARQLMITAAVPASILTAYNTKYQSYEAIPDNEKRKFWIIMVGESQARDAKGKKVTIPHYVKIPKGEAQQVVSNVVERVLTLGKQKYPDTTAEFIGSLAGDFSPVTDSSIIPAGLSQYLEVNSNFSMFRKRQIVPDYVTVAGKSFRAEDVEPRYRSGRYTSEVAKRVGDVLNWSPAKIDYVAKIGLLGYLIQGADLIMGKNVSAPDATKFEKAAQLPGVSGVLGTQASGLSEKEYQNDLEKTRLKNTEKIKKLEAREATKDAPTPVGAPVGRLGRKLQGSTPTQ